MNDAVGHDALFAFLLEFFFALGSGSSGGRFCRCRCAVRRCFLLLLFCHVMLRFVSFGELQPGGSPALREPLSGAASMRITPLHSQERLCY
jgi:hypothetical protein